MPEPSITLDDVRAARADLIAAGQALGLRPVWRAIGARTGKRPSYATVARLLAALPEAEPAAVDTHLVALTQQFAAAMPDLWRAALNQASQSVASELAQVRERAGSATQRVADLTEELERSEADRSTIGADRDRIATTLAGLETRVAVLTDTLAEQYATHRTDHVSWNSEQRHTAGTIAQLQSDLAGVRAHETTASQQRDEAIRARDAALAATADATAERERILTLHAAARSDLAEARRDLTTSRAEAATALGRADDRQRDVAALRRQVNDLEVARQVAEIQAATSTARVTALEQTAVTNDIVATRMSTAVTAQHHQAHVQLMTLLDEHHTRSQASVLAAVDATQRLTVQAITRHLADNHPPGVSDVTPR